MNYRMKKIACMLAVACFAATTLWAQGDVSAKEGEKKEIVEKVVTVQTETDSSSEATLEEGLGKLTSEQLFELERIKAERGRMTSVSDIMQEVLLPIVATTVVFLTIGVVVFFILYYRHKEKKGRYELMAKAIEAGRDIPADFFNMESAPKSPLGSIATYVAVGLGIIIFFTLDGDIELVGIGLIPLLIGVGKFIAWKYEQKKESQQAVNTTETSTKL